MSNGYKREAVLLNEKDNVAVLLTDVEEEKEVHYSFESVKARSNIKKGHKIAINFIPKGRYIVKYGIAIGIASCDIEPGTWVHVHNVFDNTDELCSIYEESMRKKILEG